MLLLNGDCIEQMQKLIDEGVRVESVVTDPPYELGFMGKSWDASGIAFDKKTWELAFQLLKPGGYLLAFSASRNYHRMAVAVEDAGFEIRDQIMWIYGSGFPKSLNIGMGVDKKQGNERVTVGERTRNVKPFDDDNGWNSNNTTGNHIYTKGNSEWEGWGTALKPAHEPIVMARKPLEGTVVDNVLEHGVGGINIDGCRVGLSEGDDPRLGGKGTWKTDKMANNVYGDYEGKEAGSSELGRFPANVMHDGSDVVVKGFPNAKGWSSQKHNTFNPYGGNALQSSETERDGFHKGYDDNGSAARFFYCPKVSKSERNQGLDNFVKKNKVFNGQSSNASKDMKGVEQKFTTKPSANIHPTVKPQELMKYLCRLVTPKGGTVLDPFMGSGSTGMAAKDEGFDFIGIEREKEYFEISEQRIKTTAPLSEFFA